MQDLAALLPIVAIALLFWLLIVRPASRRQAKMRNLQSSLEVGSEVLLAAGLFGIVRSVEDDRIGLEVADGVIVHAAKAAVVQVLDPTDDSAFAEDPDDVDYEDDADYGDVDDDSVPDLTKRSSADETQAPGAEGSK